MVGGLGYDLVILGFYWGFIGIMENRMETTICYLGFRVYEAESQRALKAGMWAVRIQCLGIRTGCNLADTYSVRFDVCSVDLLCHNSPAVSYQTDYWHPSFGNLKMQVFVNIVQL